MMKFTRQDKTRQDKTRQDKTRQDKTRQDKTRQDISVVVQGVIDKKLTPKCLKSIRKYLPKAVIILSTWENSNVSGLDYDILVENKDPGTVFLDSNHKIFNNCNRQLVSTQNGLKQVNTDYVLKVRSDLELKNNKFLRYWKKFPAVDEKYRMFESRIIVHSVYSREFSDKTEKSLPFCTSDFFYFGLTQDVRNLLNVPLMKCDELADWRLKKPKNIPYKNLSYRYSTEQYICFKCVNQVFPDIEFSDWSDWNSKNVEQSKYIMTNNFIMLGYEESGIFSEKHDWAMKNEHLIPGLITFKRFVENYRELCEKDFNPKTVDFADLKFKKHFKEVLVPFKFFLKRFKPFLKWCEAIIACVYYLFKMILLPKDQ